MKKLIFTLIILVFLATACAPVDLNAPMPEFDTGADPEAWAKVPAGPFQVGQFNHDAETAAYEIMVNLVTTEQYAQYLTDALAAGELKVEGNQVLIHYPGDEFNAYKHEERFDPGDYLVVPLDDPSLRVQFDGSTFTAQPGYEMHPMTTVTWFGGWGYCLYNDARLPTDYEWEKAARGEDDRPHPWGHDEVTIYHANYSASRDPYESMATFGSRTTPIGFYNGSKYGDFQTIDAASPYGLNDMAGNVWQWTGDVYKGIHYRMLRGGSKDTYAIDLRLWVKNNATPTYFSPGAGFRCARDSQ